MARQAAKKAAHKAATAGAHKAAKAPTPKPKGDLAHLPALPTTVGRVYAAGANTAGELGLDPEKTEDEDDRSRLEAIVGLGGVVDLACGGMHSAAITPDGRVYTWGNNDEKALGRTSSDAAPALAEGLEGVRIVQVACGDNCSFALADDGRLFGCGTFRDLDGVFGFQQGVKHQPIFAPVASLVGVRVARVAVGANHVLVLTATGRVLAFGSGQRRAFLPLDINTPKDVLARSVMEDGPSVLGRVLHRDPTQMLRAAGVGIKFRSADPVVDVFAGSYASFAVTASGRVFAWGLNKNGQLGLGHHDPVSSPTLVPELSGKGIVALAGGDFHTLALTASGDVLGIGRARDGQLGLKKNVTDDQVVPKLIELPNNAKAAKIACGSSHSLVVTRAGALLAFGNNSNCQLAQENDDDVFEPRPAKFRKGESAIALTAGGGGQFSAMLGTTPGRT